MHRPHPNAITFFLSAAARLLARTFVPAARPVLPAKSKRGSRNADRFEISVNTDPRKLLRWMRRGGAPAPLARSAKQIAMAHLHPRHKRPAPSRHVNLSPASGA